MSSILSMARTLRRHSAVKEVLAAPRRWALHATQSRNRGVFAIDIEATCGFFAIMQLVVFVLRYCEEHDQRPVISARGGLYGEPTCTVDWFAQLFQQKFPFAATSRAPVHVSRVRSVADLGFRSRYEAELTIPIAHRLFSKHFRVQPEIHRDVQSLCAELAISERTLGVHYRGTDKISEARRLSREEVVEAVHAEIDANPELDSILLASDEREFLDFFLKQRLHLPVRIAPAKHLSKAGSPVHFSNHPGLEIGREALTTCVLLSRCGALIKTPSYLSAWAKIFNPDLRVRLLADSKFFPDHALWLEQGLMA